MINKFVIFLIIWGFTLTVGQSETNKTEGQTCTEERTNSDGICKIINKCPSVINDLRNRRNHTRCGYNGILEIVCCPININDNGGLMPTSTNLGGTRRLHEEKCKEYKAAVYNYIYSTELSSRGGSYRIPIDKCGHKKIPLFVGVALANPREFPHMAYIGFDVGNSEIHWTCSGTLISDRYVLMAAHCLYSRQFGEPKFVRLGDLIIDSDTDEAQPEDYNIETIIPHPEWKLSSKYNDIGLLKLDRNVNLSPYKRPACLPVQFDEQENLNIGSGWVETIWAGSGSKHLQKVILEKFSFADCNETYSSQINRKFREGIRDNTQICAGLKTNTDSDMLMTCKADTGGPLQVYHQSEYCMYTVIGISSFGMKCGNIGVPGVYTRIFPFIDWIENIVWKS